jgi:hypothetical protein
VLTVWRLCLESVSLLLVIAAATKLLRPGQLGLLLDTAGLSHTRAITTGLVAIELLAGIAGLTLPARGGGTVVALTYAALAGGAALVARRAPGLPCGCFGDGSADRALGSAHVIGCAAAAALATVAAVTEPPAGTPLTLVLSCAAALVIRALLKTEPATFDASARRLVDRSARLLEPQVLTRRSLLIRIAAGGSALAIAPLRYLLYPGTAMAVIVPSRCTSGLCADGYTAFCCELQQGGANTCPAGTFPGGWWQCTDYRGQQLCKDAGVRYYVDCNNLPGHPFPGGCRCANDSCSNRRQACNVFRYGQCNTHIAGTTTVVCRMVTCENPGRIPQLGCSTALMVDNAVCGHEASCLEPPAFQLPGVGGA